MRKTVFVIGVVFLVFCVSGVSSLASPAAFQSVRTERHTAFSGAVDLPTWYQGDSWTYTIDPLHYVSTNGSFSGTIQNLREEVVGIVGDAYELAVTGEISGQLVVNGISGDLSGDITGTTYMRVSDLAQETTEAHSQGTIIVIVPLPYMLDVAVSSAPALELYDFPTAVGEEWQLLGVSTTTGMFSIPGIYEQSLNGSAPVDEVVSCTAEEAVMVPAGTFECYKVSRGSTSNVWYSSDTGNIVKTVLDQSDGETTIQMTQSLKSFSRAAQPLTVSELVEPVFVLPGDPVTVSGQVVNTGSGTPVQNAVVTISIPSAGQTWTTTTGSDGRYSMIITAPTMHDDTPSGRETGSGGVIVSCTSSGLTGYQVQSLVTIFNTPPGAPSVNGQTDGNVGVAYDYTVSAVDPQSDDVSYLIDWGDGTTSGWIGPFPSGETQTVSHVFATKGTFTISATAKDSYGAVGPAGTLQVKMPLDFSLPFFSHLLERFPHLFPLLRFLLHQ